MNSRRFSLVVCLLTATLSLDMSASAVPQSPVVNVCVRFDTVVNFDIVARGQTIASRLYEDIGVHLRWSCHEAAQLIMLRLAGRTPSHYHPGALAVALPYENSESRIVVFYDRLKSMMETRPVSAAAILGHVLAHEIGHVLEGVARPTDCGLMRARFTADELATMASKLIPFSEEDRVLIRQTIRARLAAADE